MTGDGSAASAGGGDNNPATAGPPMKRAAAAGMLLLFAILLAPTLAGASHGNGPAGPRDFAVGGGTTGSPSTGVQHVDFAASGGPTSFDPSVGIGGAQ
jgi:hypothetical protein